MRDIVLLGPQGCGKGTQAKILLKKYDFVLFEMGAECRKEAKKETPRGQKVKAQIDAGNLAPIEVIAEIFGDFVAEADPAKPILFDGIPRNEEQKVVFDSVMKKHNRDFKVIEIDIPRAESIKRLLSRAKIEGRADDKHDAIIQRLDIFYADTLPIVNEYKAEGRLILVNGDQPMEDVAKELESKLQEVLSPA